MYSSGFRRAYQTWFADLSPSVRRVFALGLLLRFVYLAAVLALNPSAIHYSDSVTFLSPIPSLVFEGVYGLDGIPDPFRTPGYPLFCAVISGLASLPLLIPLAQTLLVYPLTFILIARPLENHRHAWLAMASLALDVPHIVYGATIMADTVFLLGLVCWLRFMTQHGFNLRSGLATGILYLVRPVLWPFLLALLLAKPSIRPNFKTIGLFAMGILFVLAPWVARNRVTFGHYFVSIHTTESLFKTLVPPLRQPNDPIAQKNLKSQLLEETDHNDAWQTHLVRRQLLDQTIRENPRELARLAFKSIPAFLFNPERSSWVDALQLKPLPGRLSFRSEDLATRFKWLLESPLQLVVCAFQLSLVILTWIFILRARRWDLRVQWLIVIFVTLTFWVSTTSLTARKRMPLLAVLPALMLSRRPEDRYTDSDLT